MVLMLIIALVLSLSAHEFGHAIVAKWNGDRTAEQQGRLTLNPIAHIDVMGLLMVILVGFGYAKPVPTNPANFTSRFSTLWVAGAGPFMNLLVAVVVWNAYLLLFANGMATPGVAAFCEFLARINLLLMLFNLIPLGPLDGHYILPYFLPRQLAYQYQVFNARHGTIIFLAIIVLSILGLPVLSWIFTVSTWLLDAITLFAPTPVRCVGAGC